MKLLLSTLRPTLSLGTCLALAIAPILVLPSNDALAEPVSPLALDASFGTGGVVRSFPAGTATSVAIQEDGFIVAAGTTGDDFALVRLTPDGLPDPSFGVTGVVTTDLGGVDRIEAIALQADQRIVVVGDSGSALAVARYTITGTLDNGFGNGGYFTTTLPSRPYFNPYRVEGLAVDVLDDGLILVGGRAGSIAADSAVLICVQAQGILDPGCGPDGVLTATTYSSTNWVSAIRTQSNGQILVLTNWYSLGTAKTGGFRVSRWNADLSPDLAYGTGGGYASNGSSDAKDMVTTPSDAAWVVSSNFFVRLDESGFPDARYGANLWLPEQEHAPRALVVRPNAELVSIGFTTAYTESAVSLLTLDSTGRLPTIVKLDLSVGNDYGYAAAPQEDGAIVLAGESGGAFFVARVTGEPFSYVTLPIILNVAPPAVVPAGISPSQSRSRRRPRRSRSRCSAVSAA